MTAVIKVRRESGSPIAEPQRRPHVAQTLSDPAGRLDGSVRTLFLSDVHLGTKGCQAEMLLDFMKTVETDTIVLVGDIIDGWRLKAGWYWPQLHNDVVQKLLRRVRKGARIIYVPGNHDEFLHVRPGRGEVGGEAADILRRHDGIRQPADDQH